MSRDYPAVDGGTAVAELPHRCPGCRALAFMGPGIYACGGRYSIVDGAYRGTCPTADPNEPVSDADQITALQDENQRLRRRIQQLQQTPAAPQARE